MNKYLFGLIGLALLGAKPLLGQPPAAVPNGPGGVPVDAPVLGAGPGGVASTPTKTTCVPERYIKKTTKAVYSSRREPLCLFYFRGLFGHCSCDAGHCEHPYTRRFLIKKIKTCEEDATKCVPAEVPAFSRGRCRPASDCVAAPPFGLPTVEVPPRSLVPPVPPVEQIATPKAK